MNNFKILFFLTFLVNCTTHTKDNLILDYYVVNEIKIDVPDSVNYSFEFWDIAKLNKKYYLYGLRQNAITIFNLDSKKYEKTIKLDYEGVNGLGNVSQFYTNSKDSIFVFSKSDRMIALINSNAEITNIYDVNYELKNNPFAFSIECFRNYGDAIYYKKNTNELILRTFPPYDLVKDVRTYMKPYKIKYNIKTRKISSFFGIFPKEFKNPNDIYSNDYKISYVENKGKQLFSFRRSHYIFEVKDNEVIKKHYAASNFINNNFKLIARESNFDRIRKHYLEEPAYENLLFDKKKKLYYRLVSHKVKDGLERSLSVILLNEKLKVIGEVLLPRGKYFIKSAKVHDDGLFLYKYNKDESLLTYDIISINTKSKL